MSWSQPQTDRIREALRLCAPQLADEPIAFLAEGWEFWAYSAGDHVLRFPREIVNLHRLPGTATNLGSLDLERRLLPVLASSLTTPVPQIDVYCEDGPNGAPFAGHRFIPGETVLFASSPPGPGFGRDLGRLLRELWSFPAERAAELGVPRIDGTELRAQRARHYERVIRRLFPLVSCEARSYIERSFEAYLNDKSNFDYEPHLVHQDLDMNVLIDAATGELSGVIDFGGAVVSNRALDLWLPLYGFERLGIESQIRDCIDAAGLSDAEVERMRGEVAFVEFNFPLTDMLSGLERKDEAQIEDGLRHLNASVPRELRCE
ncbi:MAG TPA: phosphotransferase [Dehalococcoidia bacterium]|nr:phosphotransferase [Dehalococcoidia bacterium]